MDDRISELPDCILSYILTMLSIKDLLKTSILSRRWCNLWAMRRDLYFDIFNVLGNSEEELLKFGYLVDVHSDTDSTIDRCVDLKLSTNEFVKRVNQFVKNFQGTKIDSFLVNFYMNSKHNNTIDQWISFAIARGVERIDLLFYARHTTRSRRYKFDFGLFSETNASNLKHMRLEDCLVFHPTNWDFIPFKNLRSLSLKFVKLDEIFIEGLLSNCRRLEDLRLDWCEFKSSTQKILSSSLRHLKVMSCYFVSGDFRKDINLSSIVCLKLNSLEYYGYELDNFYFNTPLLKSIHFLVSYSIYHKAFALFATLPKLEILQLDIYSKVPTSLKITQPLKHLNQLNFILFSPLDFLEDLEFDLLWILNILEASPLLQKLSVMLTRPKIIENQKVVKDVDICSHDEVLVIELRGCVGNIYEIEFVMNVLKYANKLKQIVLSPYWREDKSSGWNSDPAWFKNGRQRILEELQGEDVVGREKLVLI